MTNLVLRQCLELTSFIKISGPLVGGSICYVREREREYKRFVVTSRKMEPLMEFVQLFVENLHSPNISRYIVLATRHWCVPGRASLIVDPLNL